MKDAANSWIKEGQLEFFFDGMKHLVHRWQKCVTVNDDHIEKWAIQFAVMPFLFQSISLFVSELHETVQVYNIDLKHRFNIKHRSNIGLKISNMTERSNVDLKIFSMILRHFLGLKISNTDQTVSNIFNIDLKMSNMIRRCERIQFRKTILVLTP